MGFSVLLSKPDTLIRYKGVNTRLSKSRMVLFHLPEDVLYLILSKLDCRSLCRLSQVCRRSHHFIHRDTVWRKIAKGFINTGITREGADL